MPDAKSLSALKKLQALSEEEIGRLYMEVFNNDNGAIVLEDIKQRCFFYVPTIDANSHVTYAREGMRSVALMIDTRLNPLPTQEE